MKKIKETPTEKYLREIVELLKIQNSRPILPPYNISSPQLPNIQGYTCMMCHQWVYGQHNCYGGSWNTYC